MISKALLSIAPCCKCGHSKLEHDKHYPEDEELTCWHWTGPCPPYAHEWPELCPCKGYRVDHHQSILMEYDKK